MTTALTRISCSRAISSKRIAPGGQISAHRPQAPGWLRRRQASGSIWYLSGTACGYLI